MSLDSEDEDFQEYGCPLDPLDEDSLPRKKGTSLRDQIATDKHGRRRFHGAFTGGFSAGFYNSVGSLEGWTPSTFKSSRSDKAKMEMQKPEDFMDDEDMDEFGIAPKVLRATSDFSSTNLKRKKNNQVSDGPIPGEPVLNAFLQPAKETVGIKLLMKMGWKPGQGIGPRVTRTEKKRMKEEYKKTKRKVYGCSLPQDMNKAIQSESDSQSSSEDENLENVTFAPEDFQPALCKPKDNCFGLGYKGLDRRPILSGHVNLFAPSHLRMEEKKKKISISGQAFGVGAFEEEDEDIYSKEDMSQYDFALESTSTTSKQKQQQYSIESIPNYAGQILEGFILGKNSESFKKYFPPPLLPQGFQPIHESRKSRFEPAVPEKSVSLDSSRESLKKGLQRHKHTAVERAVILEEVVTKSSQQMSDILSKEGSNQNIEQNNGITEKITMDIKQGYSKFRPFAAYPDKEKRYEKFLELSKKGLKDQISYYQPITMTEWEKERERVEFEQAARLYQPLSGLMSDRFVSASQAEDLNSPLLPLSKPVDKESDKQEAARMKMFGRLTREETDWRPCSLLCKRFNVPELFPGSGESSNTTKRSSKFSVFDFLDAATYNKSQNQPVSPKANTDTLISVEPPDIIIKEEEITEETDVEKMPETEKPSEQKTSDSVLEFPDPPDKIDLFKAIFLSSSEDSGSENEDGKTEEEKQPQKLQMADGSVSDRSQSVVSSQEVDLLSSETASPSVNIQRNLSPPRGVFANLDLDAINIRGKIKSNGDPAISNQMSVSDSNEVPDEDTDILKLNKEDSNKNSEDVYGPKIPTTFSSSQKKEAMCGVGKTIPSVVASVSSQWIEVTDKNSKKDKHKKHKKSSKHKKHKSKHKKKKH